MRLVVPVHSVRVTFKVPNILQRFLRRRQGPAGRPFMGEAEIRLIRRYLRIDDVMLEWGSGGSTLEFSRHVARYCSIEHDPEWHARVRAAVEARGVANVTLLLVPPNLPLDGLPNYARTPEERYTQFKDYIEAVGGFDVAQFDRVLIDGRSRPECAARVLPRLAPGAIVFIHDFFNPKYDREPYHALVLRDYEVIDAVREGQTLAVLRPRQR
jgi:predicted O-methyltransferase YrrM